MTRPTWSAASAKSSPHARSERRRSDTRALFNHDANYPLGRVKAGTLKLSANDPHGWRYRVLLPQNPMAAMVAEAIERGDVTGSSFSFEVNKDDWSDADAGTPTRVLREVRAYDVGPVTFPASEATDVNVPRAMRSLATKHDRDRLPPARRPRRPPARGPRRRVGRRRRGRARAPEDGQNDAITRVSDLRQMLDAIS